MHFPYNVGRQVVEVYVTSPHFTNIICWAKYGPYNPFHTTDDASVLDPRLCYGPPGARRRDIEGVPARCMIEDGARRMAEDVTVFRGDGGNSHPSNQLAQQPSNQAMRSDNWRQPQQQNTQMHGGVVDNGPRPTAHNRGGMMAGRMTAGPPNLDGPGSPAQRPGQIIQCIADESGNYVPVTPSGGHHPHQTVPALRGGSNVTDPRLAIRAIGQQLNTQQPSFENMRGSGHVRGGHRGDRGGRGGRSGRGGRGGRGGMQGGVQGSMHGAPSSNNMRGTLSSHHRRGSPSVNSMHGTPSVQHMRGTPSAHSIRGGHRFNEPRPILVQQSTGGPASPTVHHMRSQLGIDDLFGTPRDIHQANAMADAAARRQATSMPMNDNIVRFQHAASTANFVPQSVSTQLSQAMTVNTSMQSDSRQSNAITGQSTPIANVQAQHQYGYVPPVETTPSHAPANRHLNLQLDTGFARTTPNGRNLYPTPVDGDNTMLTVKKEEVDSDEERLAWLSVERQRLIVDAQIARIKYETRHKKRGAADPEEMKEGNMVDWASNSAVERCNISPVRGSDGGVLDSVSKHGSPRAKARQADANR